jgi:hypothetical protein
MATEPPARRWFLRPFENPWVGLIVGLVGTLATIGSFIYAVYWRDHPELTYLVAATRARIVVAGQASALRVFHGESPITTDVTAAQIALWNGGRRAVEAGDVLQPLRLLTEPRVPILEAQWRYATRELCALDLEKSLAQGELPIRFRILEPQDGGVLQVIYAGSPDVSIQVAGAVKNQPELRVSRQHRSKITSTQEVYLQSVLLVALSLLAVPFGILLIQSLRSWRTLKGRTRVTIQVIGPLFVVSTTAYLVLRAIGRALGNPAPPFPF